MNDREYSVSELADLEAEEDEHRSIIDYLPAFAGFVVGIVVLLAICIVRIFIVFPCLWIAPVSAVLIGGGVWFWSSRD